VPGGGGVARSLGSGAKIVTAGPHGLPITVGEIDSPGGFGRSQNLDVCDIGGQ